MTLEGWTRQRGVVYPCDMTSPHSKTTCRVAWSIVCATLLSTSAAQAHPDTCPRIYEKGTLGLEFNPGFIQVDPYDDGQGLTISSFFNAATKGSGNPPVTFFERDLVARIAKVDKLNYCPNPATGLVNPPGQELTDLATGAPKTVWPNEAARVPDGVFPFEAVMIPQGFLSAGRAGRLTAIDLATGVEYLIHQSTLIPGQPPFPPSPANAPRFYHRVVYMDMNADGLEDLVTVRSGFLTGPVTHPPSGELVWFANPGDSLDPNVPWQATVLVRGFGPDIALEAADLDGDGVKEIVATHFFTGDSSAPPGAPATKGKIAIYGPQPGMNWSDVSAAHPVRAADISSDQGFPFDVQIVDLDRDGKLDILATNHQPDGCAPFPTVPGRVYALEQPADGNLFGGAWPTHILLDGIRPQPSLPPVRGLGRLAPGHAKAFFPKQQHASSPRKQPWIVVGGDEAGKVWILEPNKHTPWEYSSSIVFDINAYYGEPEKTQTPVNGITVSTIGSIGVGYDKRGAAELYIPIFEGKLIHVLSFANQGHDSRVECLDDLTLMCPAAAPAPGQP